MSGKRFWWWSFILLLVLTACTNEKQAPSLEEAGQEVIHLLQTKEYETIREDWLPEDLEESLSVEEISQEWEERTEGGEFKKLDSFETESKTEELDLVESAVHYSTIQFDVRMIFNENRKLVGFHLSEGAPVEEVPESIEEEEIVVGLGTEYELDGLLTLPQEKEGEIPAVILVHGSGPTDYDEAAYAYKPFRDIAWGLAEEGIAVIRYDKRTFTYAEEMAEQREELTVHEETVEDAIRATELAREDLRIDEERVFLVGHSLGGMLAPRIHAEGGDYAGIVSLAGSPRPLWEIIYDQNLDVIERLITDEEKKEEQLTLVEEEYQKAQNLNHLTDEEAREMTVFGMNGYYFKEMDEQDVPSLISDLEIPLLLLQGERDFQVQYEKDFALWQELLKGQENATFISYPNLNHFFIESEGPDQGSLAEYEVPGRVEATVIQDIGEWIYNSR